MQGKLFLVGTPIGNLGDFSLRAQEILKTVDYIAAEDTRVSLKLLNHFNIKNKMVSFHQHNEHEKAPEIAEDIKQGKNVALITDAGMPAISDPGEHLVKLCYENGIVIESVPGPTAFATAIAISGLYTGRFAFEGFLSTNKTNRFAHLEEIKNHHETLIFYEAPHKLLNTLKDMLKVFNNRKISIVKEITKLHENVFLTTISDAVTYFSNNKPMGEYVIIVEGKTKEEENPLTLEEAVLIAKKLKNEGLKATDAAKEAANISGFKKSDIYKKIL